MGNAGMRVWIVKPFERNFLLWVFINVQSITARTSRVSGQTAETAWFPGILYKHMCTFIHFLAFSRHMIHIFYQILRRTKDPPKVQNHWFRPILTFNLTSSQSLTHLSLSSQLLIGSKAWQNFWGPTLCPSGPCGMFLSWIVSLYTDFVALLRDTLSDPWRECCYKKLIIRSYREN